ELRGVWLTNVDSKVLDSQRSIAEAMHFLKSHHFNVVYPVVWNDAKTIYQSDIMDSLFGVPINPRFDGRDPLAELIHEAHHQGLKVIPWFEYGFSSSYKKDGGMILEKFPQWAARDNAGNLLKKNGFEWMNAYHPEVQTFLMDLVTEVVRKYDVDGVQGDDRLPAQPIEGGYSDVTKQLYAEDHDGALPPGNYRDPEWQHWRADQLNCFAKKLYKKVKSIKPNMLVTWSPSIYKWSYDEYLQDWPRWLNNGYADIVHPQVYRYDLIRYEQTLCSQNPDSIGLVRNTDRVFPGILMNLGEYVMSEEYLLKAVELNRELGYKGEVFFFYEGLRKNDDELANALLKTVYRQPARFPKYK
ncbi:MAG: family 10 glycosylhydrolase, partial [Candidatus Marinimicrobia bacterium]|nr:family 10 glycosylhydrolase [Candidatus Neomarinimicrobiota bacterium]